MLHVADGYQPRCLRLPHPDRGAGRAHGRHDHHDTARVRSGLSLLPHLLRRWSLLQNMTRHAFIGGIYSNFWALDATLADIRRRGVDSIHFLGDLGAFGPFPDRVPERLIAEGIPGIQGNYEESLSTGATDCHCGYTDPRDNHYAQISYDYTFAKTSDVFKKWMGALPGSIRFTAGGLRFLLVHGSPRKINEFLWSSTSPT